MWIMLIKKLPTNPSPPKLSMHWSVPWTETVNGIVEMQREWLKYLATCRDLWIDDEPETEEGFVEAWLELDQIPSPGWGMEPNWALARKIHYKGSDIRVLPPEFSIVERDNMRLYVLGDGIEGDPSHYLVPGEAAAERALINSVRTGMRKQLYDAALLDGCTSQQALCVATGMDITLPDVEFPSIGWYRCHPAYAEIYCYEWEMEE